MGTQQLLLIVLGVIIVGIAIAVGITIFNNQAYNSNQQAVASELSNYASMVNQWWKTPVAQGGAGKGNGTITAAAIATWLGFDNGTEDDQMLTTDTGTYLVSTGVVTGTVAPNVGDQIVTLIGVGNEKRSDVYPKVTTTINLDTGEVSAIVASDDNGTP